MLFLLLTQQATLSHAVSHLAPAAIAASAVQELSGDKQEFAAHACELCVAAAQFAAALPASTFSRPLRPASSITPLPSAPSRQLPCWPSARALPPSPDSLPYLKSARRAMQAPVRPLVQA